ncbi:high mobility group box domain-containing protein, partial [Blastocladiella britannica]
ATTKPARKNKRSTRIDPNEPTKPQSAYVMYANEVRAEMRDMRLTFAELAKIVGDRWKSMQPDEKRQREEAASIAKSQYHHALGMYRS